MAAHLRGGVESRSVSSAPRPLSPAASDRDRLRAGALLAVVGAALFAIRLTGAPNLLDNEYRVGACVLDVLQHGNWLCPHDVLGNTDKPPMLTWLAALASWPLGRVTPFTLYLPTALATILTAWCILGAGGRFGPRVGFLAGLAYLLSDVAAHQMGTARWDGVFALTVTVAALLAFAAWIRGGGWTAFWLVAAASTLTKGPLGVLLSLLGLGAVLWERRSGHPTRLAGSHTAGILLYLLVAVGWFLLAYRQVGPHLIQNMVGEEFVGNIVEHRVAYRFWKPPGDFLANFAPWSLFTLVGLYRVLAEPSESDEVRRFERFLFCWFVGGLLLFCLSPHNQARLMDPMIPAAALLGARELDRLLRGRSQRALTAFAAVVIIAALGIFTFEYHRLARRRPAVRETLALQALAKTVHTAVGDDFALTYVDDTPFAIQLLLDTMRPPVSRDTAARLLESDAATFVVVRDLAPLRRLLAGHALPLHELARATDGGTTYLHLVSNRATLARADPLATGLGPLAATLSGARLGPVWDNRLVVYRGPSGGRALIANASSAPQEVSIRVGTALIASWTLPAGESRAVEIP